MRLVVNVPALNEEATIGDVVKRIPRAIPLVDEIIIQVIDDGSQDQTAEEARSAGAVVISHPRNLGVGTAFHTGVRVALQRGADVMINIDGDGQFDPAQIPELARPVLEGRADFATCSRFANDHYVPQMPMAKLVGNHVFAWLVSKLIRKRFYDVSCGFRAFSRDALLRLSLREDFTYTHEVFLDLGIRGMRIVEVPLIVRGVRQHGKSRVARNLVTYGVRTTKIILRAYRDYRPLRFFGMPAIVMAVFGLALMAYCVIYFLVSEIWIKWAGFTGAFIFSLAMVFAFIAIITDMLDRLRFIQEELLYFARLQHYGRGDAPIEPSGSIVSSTSSSQWKASLTMPPRPATVTKKKDGENETEVETAPAIRVDAKT